VSEYLNNTLLIVIAAAALSLIATLMLVFLYKRGKYCRANLTGLVGMVVVISMLVIVIGIAISTFWLQSLRVNSEIDHRLSAVKTEVSKNTSRIEELGNARILPTPGGSSKNRQGFSNSNAPSPDLTLIVEALNGLTQSVSSRLGEPLSEAIDFEPVVSALEDIEVRLSDADRWRRPSFSLGGPLWLLMLAVFVAIIWFMLYKDPVFAKWSRLAKYAILSLSILSPLAVTAKYFFEAIAAGNAIGSETQLVSLIPIPRETDSESAAYDEAKAPIIRLNLTDRLTTFVIPFKEEGTCVNGEPQGGVTLSAEFIDFLKWFGSNLQQCKPEGGYDKIMLLVQGYASSSEVKGESALAACGVSHSHEANLKFAEARRQSVETVLKKACGLACAFDDGSWSGDYKAMEMARQFNDRKLSGYDEQRGMLNRRAEVTIQRAADCQMLPVVRVVGP